MRASVQGGETAPVTLLLRTGDYAGLGTGSRGRSGIQAPPPRGATRARRGVTAGRAGEREPWRKLVPRPAAARLDGAPESRRKVLREVTALFMGVEGCTRLCEDLPPGEMNALIETYFSEFLDVVRVAR